MLVKKYAPNRTNSIKNKPNLLEKNYIQHLKVLKEKILSKQYDLNRENISALTGISSRLIFYAHLGEIETNKLFYEKLMLDDINLILNYIEENQVSPNNLEGLAGFGSTIVFINKMGYLKEAEHTIMSELDDFIIESAEIEFSENNFHWSRKIGII